MSKSGVSYLFQLLKQKANTATGFPEIWKRIMGQPYSGLGTNIDIQYTIANKQRKCQALMNVLSGGKGQ